MNAEYKKDVTEQEHKIFEKIVASASNDKDGLTKEDKLELGKIARQLGSLVITYEDVTKIHATSLGISDTKLKELALEAKNTK
jgi:hypothetical protein